MLLSFASCKKEAEIESSLPQLLPPKPPSIEIKWLSENPVKIKTGLHLSYLKGFDCDSVIGIDYIGYKGEHTFTPINEKGQFINTIRKKQKLSLFQISELNAIIKDKKTYQNANITGCYQPELGFLYFKNNELICQTILCLECSKIESTAEFGNEWEFNKKARLRFKKLHDELGF
ncbi:hypothetical protein C4F50_19275 [Flavobacterium sp. KB82]|uniref:Lipoprotein n=2 Tax=Flavobacterium hungaricum TaxID=2082725 RepID=A0ABR9TNW7_9FLAO|nr:hypothetical protein [Flavobacterium hungaricum]